MALNLNIPTLKDKPFIVAETSVEKINASLSKLASNNALDFAAHLRGELTVLNRQKVPASIRIEALNAYRSRAITTALTLSQEFSNANLPLHDKAKLSANAVEGLWQELGYGYKLALVDLQNQLINLSRKKDSATAIQHAIQAITEQALTYFQTYRVVPDTIWADLYQLYFCAVQMGIQHITTDYSFGNLGQNTSPFTIESAFKLAMVMYLANPQNLTQKAIRQAATYLSKHVQHARITSITPLDATYGAFIIDLSDNRPPEPYNKHKDSPDPHVDVLLQTIELVRIIHEDLNQLQESVFLKGVHDNQSSNAEDQRNLLTHLIKHLGITPKRQFKRTSKAGELELVAGIEPAHILSSHTNTDQNAANHAKLNQRASHQALLPTSRWHVINMSATGMCIRRHASAAKNIKIGQAICYKMKDEHHWGIGVVRWAHCGNRDALVIGIQFIAPFAQGADICDLNAQFQEHALILPDASSHQQQSSMLVARNTFRPGLRLKTQWGAEKHEIICTRLIERTQHFDRIQFKLLNSEL